VDDAPTMTQTLKAPAALQRSTDLPGETLGQKFWNAVVMRGDTVALRQKELGIWREMSWTELGEAARAIAMGLAALGFEPGDTASILSNTRREWTCADYGILLAGGVSSGIYPTDSASQVEYLVSDSATSVLFVEDDEQLDKVLAVRSRLAGLKRIVVFDTEGLSQLDDPMVESLASFSERGRNWLLQHPQEFERRLASRRAADLAILVYTSGTTGRPKGAMLSHANLRCVMEHFAPELTQQTDDDKMAFLPLCHIAERMLGQFMSLQYGGRLNFVENPETVAENIREISPTIFLGVPRIWEKFYSAIQIRLKEATAFEQWAYARALAIGYAVTDRQLAGRPAGWMLSVRYWLARKLVLDNIRRLLGVHRMRWALSGAAPISPDLLKWFMALGVPMFEGYGMTESSGGGSINLPGAQKLGSVGRPQPYLQMKLSEQGEILVRGGNVFMGYLNQPQKTAEAIDAQGWLHTGDVGVIDADGFVRITDRMKDIIITAGGKNITPTEFENELKFSPYVTDAVVIGDRRPYLTCLVMIDHENVEKYAQDRSIPFSSFASLCRAPEVQALIQTEIDRCNAKFARVEQIKAFRLIEHKLTAEDEELTPTMKLKRKLVNEKYRALIDQMYGSA
jgi:long-chain acyl-CoA synthetase